jgi:hypothetical protein
MRRLSNWDHCCGHSLKIDCTLLELANLGVYDAEPGHEMDEEQKHKKLYFYP